MSELTTLDAGVRSATVIADEDMSCFILSQKQFASLAKVTPAIAIKLLSSIGRVLSKRLRRANRTIH